MDLQGRIYHDYGTRNPNRCSKKTGYPYISLFSTLPSPLTDVSEFSVMFIFRVRVRYSVGYRIEVLNLIRGFF